MTQTWMFGLPKERTKALRLLKEMDYRTVTVGMDKGAVDAICREGITAHVAMGSFSLPKADLR